MLLPSPLTLFALGSAAAAAGILGWYLLWRPPLTSATKKWLTLGLGVFPIATAISGNVQGYEATKKRQFCGSCHVMEMHSGDSDDPRSSSLASRHARNLLFGDENCYVCHADYGMFGTITTKLGGLKHVYMYITQYRTLPMPAALDTIDLYKPYPNDNCRQCHSTKLDLWQKVSDHRSLLEEVRSEKVSCASSGCHGLAHPFAAHHPSPNELGGGKR